MSVGGERPTITGLGCCCLLTAVTSACLLVFFSLHSANADGSAARPWLLVYAPVLLLTLTVLIALLCAPILLPVEAQPTARVWATWGLCAVAAAAACVRLAAAGDGGEAAVSWRVALAPLGAALIVRAATLPAPPPAAKGGPDADGLGCARALARVELPLGATTLLLLYWQLEGSPAARGWWTAAAPLLLLEALRVVAGLRAIGATARTSSPPSLRVCADRVETVGGGFDGRRARALLPLRSGVVRSARRARRRPPSRV